MILLGHWGLHAYGIIAITQLKEGVLHGSLCALVPLPALFYILTSRFTDPSNIGWAANVKVKWFHWISVLSCQASIRSLWNTAPEGEEMYSGNAVIVKDIVFQ